MVAGPVKCGLTVSIELEELVRFNAINENGLGDGRFRASSDIEVQIHLTHHEV